MTNFKSGKTSGKSAILVVSFGTSYGDTRAVTIDAIESDIAKANPEAEIRRAWTSQIIINKLKKRDNIVIDNVTEAMERLVCDKVEHVIIQPTHVLNGFEYDDIVREVAPYRDKFQSIKMGAPLLMSDSDYAKTIAVMGKLTATDDIEGNAIVWMGHGTEHPANSIYQTLQQKMAEAGLMRHYIGTVEGVPTVDDVLAQVQQTQAHTVILRPFMIVAGDHAVNDMAGDDDDSWKVIFTKAGYTVKTVVAGIAEDPDLRQIFVDHVQEAK